MIKVVFAFQQFQHTKTDWLIGKSACEGLEARDFHAFAGQTVLSRFMPIYHNLRSFVAICLVATINERCQALLGRNFELLMRCTSRPLGLPCNGHQLYMQLYNCEVFLQEEEPRDCCEGQ